MIRIKPAEISIPSLTAKYEVKVIKVDPKRKRVTLRAHDRDYELHEGDTFNFDLSVS